MERQAEAHEQLRVGKETEPAQYIRDLIREDMERNAGEPEE